MTRYRIPDFAEVVDAYRQAIARHLNQTETGTIGPLRENPTFDNVWFEQNLSAEVDERPLPMTICDDTDQTNDGPAAG